jgi:hypothetical protein
MQIEGNAAQSLGGSVPAHTVTLRKYAVLHKNSRGCTKTAK